MKRTWPKYILAIIPQHIPTNAGERQFEWCVCNATFSRRCDFKSLMRVTDVERRQFNFDSQIRRFRSDKERSILAKEAEDRAGSSHRRQKRSQACGVGEMPRRSVYVTWDESLNVRRRNTRKRFKEPTESEEVKATVEGALFVDNVLVFSIKDGFAKRSAAGATSHDVWHIISDLCLRVISYNCKVF